MLLIQCILATAAALAHGASGEETTTTTSTTPAPEIPYPVLLFPGLAGSQIQARLDRKSTGHWYCHKKSDWYRIWMTAPSLLPFTINCFVDNFRLVYNNETGLTENVPGVETRVEDFGNVTTLEYFFNIKAEQAGYYHTIMASLESKGYVRGVSLRGAPYDFRKGPYESDFDNVTKLIEEMYSENDNKKTVLVCHSNGCTNNYYFLLQASAAWKSKYIQAWVTLGGPLGGAAQALDAIATGDNYNIGLIDQTLARDLEHTFSSIGAVLPVQEFFQNITVLSLEGVNYFAKDLPKIFELLNDTSGALMWQKSVQIRNSSFPHPGVEVHCLRATGTPTLESLLYTSRKAFPKNPNKIFGEGDGTVNKVSSDACLRWSNSPDFYTVEFNFTVNHMTLATGQQSADYLLDEVLKI